MRDLKSNGTGKLYALRYSVTNTPQTRGNNWWGPAIRWDYYKELGYPKANEIEDFLPIVKTIVERHPVNEDGQKVYGMSLGGYYGTGVVTYLLRTLGYNKGLGGNLLLDHRTDKVVSFFEKETGYRSLKFFFTANQMGLMDPDSITQADTAQMNAKYMAGRAVFSVMAESYGFNTPERTAAGIGIMPVFFTNELQTKNAETYYTGERTGIAISANTKNLDKALAFLDFMYSWDGAWELKCGPKGVTWDLDADGEPYWTELKLQIDNNPDTKLPNGSVWGSIDAIISGVPLGRQEKHPVYKRTLDATWGTGDWIDKPWYPRLTKLQEEWNTYMNAEDQIDYLTKNNMIRDSPYAPMPTAPEEIRLMEARIAEVVVHQKLMYAKDEAEFDAVWNDMVAQAKDRGLDTVQQWYRQAYAEARAAGAKYMW
jgi:putative aldouronate transport system substrate-binding protein